MISMREIYYQHAPRAFLPENETKGTFPNFRGRTPWRRDPKRIELRRNRTNDLRTNWANAEGTGDIWYETGVLIFPVWGIQQMTTKRLVFLCSKTAPYRQEPITLFT